MCGLDSLALLFSSLRPQDGHGFWSREGEVPARPMSGFVLMPLQLDKEFAPVWRITAEQIVELAVLYLPSEAKCFGPLTVPSTGRLAAFEIVVLLREAEIVAGLSA